MKKILAFVLAVLMLCSVGAVSASAKMNLVSNSNILYLEDETIIYSIISYDCSVDARAYTLTAWVEEMGLLEDVVDYNEEYHQWLVSEYSKYIEAQREKLLKEGEAFFEKYFDRGTDELVCNSDSRSMVLVKSTVGKAKSLRYENGCNLFFADTKRDYVVSTFGEYDYGLYIPKDEQISAMEPYELIYAKDFYETNNAPVYWYEFIDVVYSYFYKLLYTHYKASEDEATPDYVLIFAGANMMSPAYSAAGFGDKYLVQECNIYYPYILGLYVITTDDMKVHTLREAWDAQIDGIEDIFTDYGLGEIRGDSDNDGKITIKDATHLQKCLAGIEKVTERDYVSGFAETGHGNDGGMFSDCVSDMNMDGSVNVKDATAIQKFLAGIEYR